MSNYEYDAIAAGHLCLDIIPAISGGEIGEIFRPGKLVNVGSAVISTGGPVSNTGIAMKKLGMNMSFIAKVGDDDFGKLAIERLRTAGNADGISISQGQNTSYTVVLASPSFDRIFLHCPGTNDTFASSDVNPDVLSKSRHFHFGYPPLMRNIYQNEGAELVEVFKKAKASGVTTSLDMSLPDPASESGKVNWRTVLAKLLPYVDVFLPSIEEALFMLEPERFIKMKEAVGGAELIDHLTADDYTAFAKTLLSMGAKMTSLKSGHRGFYFMTGDLDAIEGMGRARPGNAENWSNRELWCPAFHMPKVVAATGSGDSSIAGFLTAFLRGYDLERTLKLANCVGFQNLQAADALSGIKDWEETTAMVDFGNLAMNDLHINNANWRWDDAAKLMVGPNDAFND